MQLLSGTSFWNYLLCTVTIYTDHSTLQCYTKWQQGESVENRQTSLLYLWGAMPFGKQETNKCYINMFYFSIKYPTSDTFSYLSWSTWPLTLFLSLETILESSKTYEMTSWTYMCCFFEKNWILGYFPRIWHLGCDLKWPLWVSMVCNWY